MITLKIVRKKERSEYPKEVAKVLEWEDKNKGYPQHMGMGFRENDKPAVLSKYFTESILEIEITNEQFDEIRKAVIDKF